MRELSNVDIASVSGGLYCIDMEGLKKICWQAVNDGLVVSAILAPLTGMGVFVASSYIVAEGTSATLCGLGAGLLTAPIYAGLGFYYSNAWNILN